MYRRLVRCVCIVNDDKSQRQTARTCLVESLVWSDTGTQESARRRVHEAQNIPSDGSL